MYPRRAHRRRAARTRSVESSKTLVPARVRPTTWATLTKDADPSARSIPTVRPIKRASARNAEIHVRERAAKMLSAT